MLGKTKQPLCELGLRLPRANLLFSYRDDNLFQTKLVERINGRVNFRVHLS